MRTTVTVGAVGMRTEFAMPTTLVSLANKREHHMQRHKRNRKLREDAANLARAYTWRTFRQAVAAYGARITLHRTGSKVLDDDNLAAALKPIQDGVADALELQDGDRRLKWFRDQTAAPRDHGVTVTIEVGGA